MHNADTTSAAYHYKMTPDDLRTSIEAGMLPAQIAEKYGITKQAVSARAKKTGLMDRLKANRPTPLHLRPKKSELKYEMRMDDVQRLRAAGATRAFTRQRENAKHREIVWNLTFAQWWKIWEDSGLWEKRGRTKGAYVMSRFGDVGAYEVGNVRICTTTANFAEARAHAQPRGGVYHLNPGSKNPWAAHYRGHSLGRFPTEVAARDARAKAEQSDER